MERDCAMLVNACFSLFSARQLRLSNKDTANYDGKLYVITN